MAYYLMNKVVKLARNALGLTQEELCDGICDVRVLSRSENGKQELKKENFRKLMERMGRAAEPIYAVCVDKNGTLLEDRENMERAFKRFDYADAEKYLRRMQARADDNVLTRQYLARAEAVADYRQKRISAETFLLRLDQMLRMTVREYEKYVYETYKVFPFVCEELRCLLSLGNAYMHLRQYEKAKQTYEAILRCLKAGYMLKPDRLTLEIIVRDSLHHMHEKKGNFEEALLKIEDCLQKARKIDYSHVFAPLLVSKAYNYIWMVKQEAWDEARLENAKEYLRRAYYIAAARGDTRLMDIIKEYYTENFGIWSQW